MHLLLILIVAIASVGRAAPLELKNSNPLQAESTAEALEPWETPISGFFMRTHNQTPIVDPDHWTIVIDGLVEKPLRLSMAQIKKMKTQSFHAVLECSGNGRGLQDPVAPGIQWVRGAVGNAEWGGVSVAEILRAAKVKPGAKFARVEGADKPALPSVPGFVRSIPIEKILDSKTILAFKMNREPMPILHGGPARLILPNWYGQNWIKWVTHITLMDKEDDGFFMKKGYRMPKSPLKPGEAWDSATGTPISEIRVQALVMHPVPGALLPVGKISVGGKAFSGKGPIVKVDLSIDQGKTWTRAHLTAQRASGGWQEFEGEFQVLEPGSLTILAKAEDAAGSQQPPEREWNPSGYLRNDIEKVEVQLLSQSQSNGSATATRNCLVCHSSEMIESQRLNRGQWEKVLTKMKGFGANVPESESSDLLDYLVELPKMQSARRPQSVNFAEAEKVVNTREIRGDARLGQKLFATHCMVCHGGSGEGKVGPRLSGRFVDKSIFVNTVLKGRGVMPAFSSQLSKADVENIRAFIQK